MREKLSRLTQFGPKRWGSERPLSTAEINAMRHEEKYAIARLVVALVAFNAVILLVVVMILLGWTN